VSSETKVFDNDGNEIVTNGQQIQLVRPAGRYIVNADGSLTEAPDEYVDSFYDKNNIPPSPFASDFSRNGGEVTGVFLAPNEYNPNAISQNAPPIYTDGELAQIIADIESGKIPITGQFKADGTFEMYNLPEEMANRSLEGAEIIATFTAHDGEAISGSVVFPVDKK
jgi:hypothetical protein